MKKKILLLTTILSATAVLFLSSCLKDNSHELNFGNSGTFVDFPKGGPSNFNAQSITESGDTVTRVFAVNIASPELQNAATTVTFKVADQATVDAYNKSQSVVVYNLMPANAYKLYATKVTINAKQLYAYDSITIYKNLLDPSKSYMMPITISSTTNGKLTSNLNTYLVHIIGNDFAGTYNQDFHRWNASDTTDAATASSLSFNGGSTTIYAVSPTQFEVYSGYAGGIYRYEVSFTKTGLGSTASYTNLSVVINPDDVAAYGPGIVLVNKANFEPSNTNTLDGPFTYQQVLQNLSFYFTVTSSGNPRALTDRYYK